MNKLLLSWMAYNQDFEAGQANQEGPTLVFHRYFFQGYDRHILLYASANEEETRIEHLRHALRRDFPAHQVEARHLKVHDPINLELIQSQIEPLLLSLRDYQLDLFISPGTPTMHAAWILAHMTLKLDTRLLQMRPARFTADRKQPELVEVKIGRDTFTASAIIRQQLRDNPAPAHEERFCLTESLQPIYAQAERVAAAMDATVLILGESGTGKEHLARFIHRHSPRRDMPFEPINCSALSDDLLESRLFGFKKGSFTGADEDRVGILEAAEGGTVFLDEIGDISSYMQQVLLRVIQEKEIAPIGGPRRKIDVRFLSATNQDMKQRCEQGRFRWDLYYRLAVIDLKLPPLQQWGRLEVKRLVQFLLEDKQREFLRPHPLQLAPPTLDLLLAYPFPGNIRELENLIERLYVLCQEELVGPEHLPAAIVQPSTHASLKLKDVERQHIERVLRRNGHNQRQTARDLGVALNTLRNKVKEYGIDMPGQ